MPRNSSAVECVVPAATHIRVRPYSPADFVTLHALDQQCFVPGIAYERDELRYFLSATNSTTFVAESVAAPASGIVGFVTVQLYRGRPSYQARIITIDVSPDARKQGIGTALMLAVEEYLRSQSASRVRLEVSVENLAAQQFYRRFGYSVVGSIPRYYLGAIDALSMQKDLSLQTSAAQ
jgi:ribosomal protein S18 acetylase RimI-like enzyme